jgi:hypothetical protein
MVRYRTIAERSERIAFAGRSASAERSKKFVMIIGSASFRLAFRLRETAQPFRFAQGRSIPHDVI